MPLNATAGDFMDLREQLRAEDASRERILGSGWSGWAAAKRGRTEAEYYTALTETADFLAGAMRGRRGYNLVEAFSTSDFSLLMGDVMDRKLLKDYAEVPASWQAYAQRAVVNDFRLQRRIQLDGLEGSYYPNYKKPELTEGREATLTETGYTYSVAVYEKQFALSWQVLVNDDLNAFASIPNRLARGARRTEDRFVTGLYTASTGPDGTIYSVAHKNLVSTANGAAVANPPLSISGLQDAMTVLGNMVDADGEPIAVDMVVLVVPPALEVVANNIINATQILAGGLGQAGGGGVAAQGIYANNWMRNRVRVVVNPYLPIINTTSGSTAWYLFADPNVSRPALEIGFLRGYETPGIYQKAANMQRVGGMGGDPSALGDFDTGEIRWKGMHVIGGTALDFRATVASTGAGS
jgi:hypothetical protein